MSKLRFVVARSSGEDAAFPARELNEHAASSRGFMTPRNCEYPQELVLQLVDGLCRLTQVQLLSHQTHIATKIELFLSKDAALEDAQFSRLGYLTLKSNVESNYMARELKTVHIDNQAAWVKLVLHQCYINERNIYSQVGIMAINLCGESLEKPQQIDELPSQSTGEMLTANGSPARPAQRSVTKPAASPKPDDLSFDLRFDAKTAARIREIQLAKDQAVAQEDYDQAKRLKQMEEQLKSIGLQLTRLEAQKREAVANEDYDLAKQIKDEINMLEASVGSNESMPILPLPFTASTGSSVSVPGGYRGPGASPSHSPFPSGGSPTPSTGARTSSTRSQVLPRAGAAAVAGAKGVQGSSNFSPRDMYPEDNGPPARRDNGYRQNVRQVEDEEDEDQPAPIRRRPKANASRYNDDEEPDDDNGRQGGSSNAQSPFRGIPDAENLPEPDEIPAALAKESEQMIEVIGEFLTRCFYSNLWNHRDAAIRKVTMDLDKLRADQMSTLEVCSTLVQSGAGDRIAQVALSAFRLLDRMMAFGSRVRRDDMCHILGNSMTQLVNKLGDPQGKVRDEAAAALLKLSGAKNVGVEFVTSHVTKRSKKPLGLKLLLGRLVVIKDLIAKFSLQPDGDFSVGGIISFLEDSNAFAHQNREIRDIAKEITVALYEVVGDDIEGYLKTLRPKQLEEYQAAFEAASEASKPAVPSRGRGNSGQQQQQQQRARLPDEMRDYDHEGDGVVDGDDDDEESVDEYTCPFCGVVDEKFDSDLLDQHFWAACKMLTPCKMCGQVIEISGLNEHLLVECELKKNHKECPQCGEAITTKFYDKHVKTGDCLPRPHPKKANRCPLCHDDIAPGKSGWKQHLLEDECPNNPRN